MVDRPTFRSSEDGWVSAFGLTITLTLIGVGGLALDYAWAVSERTRLQNAADAAVLAAVTELPDKSAALAAGLDYGNRFYPEATPIFDAEDFAFGAFDPEDESFDENAAVSDTVVVAATRTKADGTALRTFMVRLYGVESFDLGVLAAARGVKEITCSSGGFFAEGTIDSGNNNDYVAGFCLYGGQAVSAGNNNRFEAGTTVTTGDLSNASAGNANDGWDAALSEGTYPLQLLPRIPGIIAQMRSATLFDAGLPDFIDKGPVPLDEMDKDTPLVDGTLYVVTGPVDLGSNRLLRNIAIVATEDIKIGANIVVENTVLATEGTLTMGSNVAFDTWDHCGGGRYRHYLFASGDVTFNSNAQLNATQIASGGTVTFNSNIDGLRDIHVEAAGDIVYNTSSDFSGCDAPLTSDFGVDPEKETPRYVRFALLR